MLKQPSEFVQSFYRAMPPLPDFEHWHQHIELLAHAYRLGLENVSPCVLVAQLENMQIAGFVPHEDTFELVLNSCLAPPGRMEGFSSMLSDAEMSEIFDVLEDMEVCGYEANSTKVLEKLHRSCIGPLLPSAECSIDTMIPTLGAARLRRHAQTRDWPSFWRTWRSYPQRFLPRTEGMYTELFDAIGRGKFQHIREVIKTLRAALPAMEREQPPVVLEDHVILAIAVMRALEHVEPTLTDGSRSSGEWKEWHGRCRAALESRG